MKPKTACSIPLTWSCNESTVVSTILISSFNNTIELSINGNFALISDISIITLLILVLVPITNVDKPAISVCKYTLSAIVEYVKGTVTSRKFP